MGNHLIRINASTERSSASGMGVVRAVLRFLMNNIILVAAGVVIASMVARHYGFTFDYKRGIEELVGLFHVLMGR